MEKGLIVLTARQRRLLAAVKEHQEAPPSSKPTLRSLAKKYDVAASTLCRSLKGGASEKAILAQSDRRGRSQRLTDEEEKLIADSIKHFESNGTPLDRQAVMDMVQTFVSSFNSNRQREIGFKTNRPGVRWMELFLQRHSELRLRKRVNLENARCEAMNPDTVAEHFARIRAITEKHGINDPTRIINLDESGFSIRGMTLGGRSKCVVSQGSRGNTTEPKFKGTCDHVTLMPVVSASGQAYTPVIVLPGKEARYRKRSSGIFETPADYLPQPNYLFMRQIAGVDSDIFYTWAQNFVDETARRLCSRC